MAHKIILYEGGEYAFRGRYICVCGILMPRVVFGIPLYKAAREHFEDAARRASQRKKSA